jgi:hypothetical protein
MKNSTSSEGFDPKAIVSKYGNGITPLLFVFLFMIVGVTLLLLIRAATPTANLESENGFVNSPATKVTDDSASADTAIKFGPAITPPPPTPQPPTTNNPPGTLIYKDDFEGRGQTISNGTIINTSNGYPQNPNSSVPPVGWYPYGQQQSSFVLPQFDSSKKISGNYSGHFGIRNQGSADNQEYTGGSYYMYRNDNNPADKMHAYFWWRFDSGMSAGGGNCALYSAWTTVQNDLTYLRFYGTGQTTGVIKWQAADNFQTSSPTATLNADTWYRMESTVDTDTDMGYLTVRDTSGKQISYIEYRIEASSEIRMFEFGALTARPYYDFPSAPGGGAFTYDDFQLNRN